ncbi:hypothetical protein GH714_000664 [Hevea brasiliensis]|uniref:RNase H type-1 domain-containing protein n=1 Tax=Hevea brasiliensis TaxID=3981 RepID=A0A6A6LQY9_HEVBR|nr:hypothetical protein GH714_000664 [Hevea brasiliensis]
MDAERNLVMSYDVDEENLLFTLLIKLRQIIFSRELRFKISCPNMFVVLSWNPRGLGNAYKKRYLRNLINKHNIDIVFLVETKCSDISFSLVRRVWGMGTLDWIVIDAVVLSGELLAISKALEVSVSKQEIFSSISSIFIESDSMNAVSWFHYLESTPWRLSSMVNSIIECKSHLPALLVKHIPCEANAIVDNLAKQEVLHSDDFIAFF